ncbi:MAG: LemA family protein [Bacteroidales bacterium]|nr:LemA family protein [Bacteroides sp.]MCM1198686.1 LemA family protein [Clostridium sp.]MCM1502582.1 LemA family protein [Bacteroidales bacterium]
MANLLDEVTGPVNDNGRDIHVIDRQLPVKTGFGSVLFEIALWVTIPVLVLVYLAIMGDTLENSLLIGVAGCVAGVLPGVIFIFMKISARNYFQQLEQRIQAEASNIDNYLEQRVQILQNVVGLVERAVELDKDVMKSVAALRGGSVNDGNRNDVNQQVNTAFSRLFPQVEAYPELKAHNAIADAMQQNSYLQREITAARTVYNSRVTQWNTDIFAWPTKMIVAARQGYTTRIPFTASAETRDMARSKFF